MNLKLDENEWKNVFKTLCINMFKCGEKGNRNLLEFEPGTQQQLTTTGCSGS